WLARRQDPAGDLVDHARHAVDQLRHLVRGRPETAARSNHQASRGHGTATNGAGDDMTLTERFKNLTSGQRGGVIAAVGFFGLAVTRIIAVSDDLTTGGTFIATIAAASP